MNINSKYLGLTFALFLTELAIWKFIHDGIIRPYIGDLLVAVFIYTFIKTFFNRPVLPTALGVLYFCYLTEISQHFHLINHLGLQNSRVAHWLLGSYFSWIDMLCYTIGILLVLIAENTPLKRFKPVRSL